MSDAKIQTWVEPLTERETEIVGLISEGLSNREISRELNLSLETIKWYNKQIYQKLGVGRRLQAVKRARELGLLRPGPDAAERGAERLTGNLPARLTSFVGRERELAEVKRLLKTSRLVTLTGPGGSGKTRLALEVGRELLGAYQDGIWFVELGAISDPSLVADSIAEDVKAGTGAERSPQGILRRFLAEKHLLLILDNMEHLLGAAPLLGDLLAAAPKLSILATSRERVHVTGEQEYPVEPLPLPDLTNKEDGRRLQDYDSIHLFIERARGVQPGFSPDRSQTQSIARICITVGGLPLAIELAASHLKILPPAKLAERLEKGLDALPPGPRDLPSRQRTLRATIQWSYDLLGSAERKLLARMAIFRGGSTLEAIRNVCSHGLPEDLTGLLSGLVEKNLVIPREGLDGELRFEMLPLIRAFGLGRLESSGELADLQLRHAQFYTRMVEGASQEMRTHRQNRWFKRLAADQDNIRAVLSWSLSGNQVEFGTQIVSGMMDYWYYNGAAAEGRRWIEQALEKGEDVGPAQRAGVLGSAARIAHALGDLSTSREYSQRALELYRTVGNERRMAWTLADLGVTYMVDAEQISKGIQFAEQGLGILRALDDKPGMASALNIVGELYRVKGDDEAAEERYRESLALVKETGERQREAMLYSNLSYLACHRGEYERGLGLVQRSLRIIQELDNDYGFAAFVGVAAGPAAGLGKWEHATQLLGASHALYEKLGSRDQFSDQMEYDRTMARVREHMSEADFDAAWREGHELSRADILSIVFDELGE
jgi:predicted ATPase/DNA-binding CsgD family transcriptional regulator